MAKRGEVFYVKRLTPPSHKQGGENNRVVFTFETMARRNMLGFVFREREIFR